MLHSLTYLLEPSGPDGCQPVKEINVGQQAILKIAAARTMGPVGAAGLVAVSSVKGLFVVRICDGQVERASPPESRPNAQPYHDLKWTAQGLWAGPSLLRACRTCRVQRCAVQAPCAPCGDQQLTCVT